jgi:hypothetical protein
MTLIEILGNWVAPQKSDYNAWGRFYTSLCEKKNIKKLYLLYGQRALSWQIVTISMIQTTRDSITQSKPGLKNRPISLVRFGRDQPIKWSDSAFFKLSRSVSLGHLIYILSKYLSSTLFNFNLIISILSHYLLSGLYFTGPKNESTVVPK